MENINSQNHIDKIEFLIKNLINFSNENEFDFVLYQSFANENSKTFNRYFALIDNVSDKAKIISDLETDFYYFVDEIVSNMLSTRSNNGSISDGTTYIAPLIPDTRIRGHESNYKQLIELFLNSVEFDLKPQPKPVPENQNPFPLIFTGIDNKAFTLFETFAKRHVLDKFIDFSFIFQQMKFNGYISDIKHLKFMKWLHENNYLTNNEYSFFIEQSTFRTLKKCAFGTRVDLYLKLKSEIIFSSSDLSE
jgi:hypothetical protein